MNNKIIQDTARKLSCTEKAVFTRAAIHFKFGAEKGIQWYESYCRNSTIPELVINWCLTELTGGKHNVEH